MSLLLMKRTRTKKIFAIVGIGAVVAIVLQSIYFFSQGDFMAGSYFFPLLLLVYVFFVNK